MNAEQFLLALNQTDDAFLQQAGAGQTASHSSPEDDRGGNFDEIQPHKRPDSGRGRGFVRHDTGLLFYSRH